MLLGGSVKRSSTVFLWGDIAKLVISISATTGLQNFNIIIILIFVVQGVFTVDFEKGLTLTEIGEGVSVEDVKAATKCNFKVCMHCNIILLNSDYDSYSTKYSTVIL